MVELIPKIININKLPPSISPSNGLTLNYTSGATGLPPSLSQFVFCQYRFPGEEEISTVPPVFTPNPKAIELIRVFF